MKHRRAQVPTSWQWYDRDGKCRLGIVARASTTHLRLPLHCFELLVKIEAADRRAREAEARAERAEAEDASTREAAKAAAALEASKAEQARLKELLAAREAEAHALEASLRKAEEWKAEAEGRAAVLAQVCVALSTLRAICCGRAVNLFFFCFCTHLLCRNSWSLPLPALSTTPQPHRW